MTLSKGQGHRTGKNNIDLFSQTIFTANLMGTALKVSYIIEHLSFPILRCVTLNEGQGQYIEQVMHSHV